MKILLETILLSWINFSIEKNLRVCFASYHVSFRVKILRILFSTLIISGVGGITRFSVSSTNFKPTTYLKNFLCCQGLFLINFSQSWQKKINLFMETISGKINLKNSGDIFYFRKICFSNLASLELPFTSDHVRSFFLEQRMFLRRVHAVKNSKNALSKKQGLINSRRLQRKIEIKTLRLKKRNHALPKFSC